MKDELKRIFKSKMLLATLVGVVILPLIYGGLYLWAFWDPYGKMENLPIAIVNEDKCAQKNDKKDTKEYCFGNDLINELKDKKQMNWQFVDKQTAEDGLKNKKYYTLAVIPEDFSENILSVDGDSPQQAKIEFKSRQASSFMAAKFSDTAFVKIKAALNEKISKEYFDNIFDSTRDSVIDLEKAVNGSSDLKDGLEEAKNGSSDLYDGIDKVNSGAVDLRNGLNQLHDGSEKLAVGASEAFTGTNSLITGSSSLNAGLNNLVVGSGQLQSATDNLISGQSVVINEINAYLSANPEATSSVELMTALTAAGQVSGGLTQVKSGLISSDHGLGQLVNGSEALKNGLLSLSVGISNLATGSASLRDNLSSAIDGSSDLISGIEKVKDGSKDLEGGLSDAYDGSAELKDKLIDAVNTTKNKTNKTKNENQSEVMSKPVDIHDISIDIVNNNGTGFAPYFIPLALWVGGMAIFFLVDLENKKKVKNKFREFLPKIWVSLIVSTLQTVTLGLVLMGILGLKVNHLGWLILFGILLGWASTLIQMFLTLAWGLPGKFVGIVLLMLQLTSSAGSYPAETIPKFFQKISTFLPMTYAVSALREIISGDNLALIVFDIKIILVFIFISLFFIWGLLLKKRK
jgi:putative membrane protein